MDTLTALQQIAEIGYPIAAIAKHIGYDPSTLNKWVNGRQTPSVVLQQKVREEIIRLKNEWMKIDIE